MKFLVTGSAGLVGTQVIKDLSNQGHTIYSCYHESKPSDGILTQLDLTKTDNIVSTVEKTNPDAIIHLAAITDVDLCETEQELAMTVNAKATETLAKQAAKNDSFFVYVSTDYVFDGTKSMKKENDLPNPLCFYGKTKLEGENRVQNLASSWCIARTSTPFGISKKKKSFPLFVAESLQNNNEIKVLIDQFTSPTYLPNLSRMLIEIATRQISGIIHVAGATRISRYEQAELVADKLNLNKKLLQPITMDEISWKAKRPKDSSLDISLAAEILNEKPLVIDQSLDYFIQELQNK